ALLLGRLPGGRSPARDRHPHRPRFPVPVGSVVDSARPNHPGHHPAGPQRPGPPRPAAQREPTRRPEVPMTAFTTATHARTSPDPDKHVNYPYGMVLGVDDFIQEFAYLSAHDRQLARELVGFGRVRGLEVTFTPATATTQAQLQVAPGVAVLPSGQLVMIS